VVLVFLPPPSPEREAALSALALHQDQFSDANAMFFGVLPDQATFAAARDRNGIRWFRDFDGELRRLYHALDDGGGLRPEWFLIDPGMRLLAWGPLSTIESGLSAVRRLGRAEDHAGVPMTAPVLIVPRVLEPTFCRALIDNYEAVGGTPSGVMRTVDGRFVGQIDDFKRRKDAEISEDSLRDGLRRRIVQRLLPEIENAFSFEATRIERFIVACYDAADGGYFKPHRDNRAPETAHRRFAVSINLNSEEFEGGDLRFPEYGSRTYRAPTGGAVVFGAGILHEATAVTRGCRFATLPFLYDEAGAHLREEYLARQAQEDSAPSTPPHSD
jgi:predicted 2-oxoglutarate/Fe(II)-dependent dioxygenase YbiX